MRLYEPVPSHVASPHPRNGVDFSSDGAYSVYNWELFFHIPLLVEGQPNRINPSAIEDIILILHYTVGQS